VNAASQPKPVLSQDKIVWLACQIWQAHKSQTDRKHEYWLRAEQLLATRRPRPVRQARASK